MVMVEDIRTLPVLEIQTKYYRTCEKDFEYSFEDGYLNIPFMDKIRMLDFNKELTLDYYLNYGGEDVYTDAINYLETSPLFELGDDNYICSSEVSCINTYNYESYLSRILQFSYAFDTLSQRYIVCLEVHDGVSDARAGYSPIFIYTTSDLDDFLMNLESCVVRVNGLDTVFFINGEETNIYREGVCDEYADTWKVLECLEYIDSSKIVVED